MSTPALQQSKDIIAFDRERLDLIRKTVGKNLNPLEFELFVAVAQTRGLDPIVGQMHAVVRKGQMTIQTGIDGYRLIAGRTGEYAGSDEPIFEYDEKGKPLRCKITVYRLVQGHRCAFTATAKWSEYYPGKGSAFIWDKMPEVMLAKVAEAQALRKAFPSDLSGLYINEEMDQAERDVVEHSNPTKGEALKPEIEPADSEQTPQQKAHLEKIVRSFAALRVSKFEIQKYFAIKSLNELTGSEIIQLVDLGNKIKSGQVQKSEVFK